MGKMANENVIRVTLQESPVPGWLGWWYVCVDGLRISEVAVPKEIADLARRGKIAELKEADSE